MTTNPQLRPLDPVVLDKSRNGHLVVLGNPPRNGLPYCGSCGRLIRIVVTSDVADRLDWVHA